MFKYNIVFQKKSTTVLMFKQIDDIKLKFSR